MATLQPLVEDFATTLNDLTSGVLNRDATFGVNVVDDLAIVAPVPFVEPVGSDIPLVRSCDDPDSPVMFLRARYQVRLDDEEEHLRVDTSTMGLFVRIEGKSKPRPIVRVEYDRTDDRMQASAHVHLHANSPELAWLYGLAGRPAPDLHSLHFPVGGRRFRPTLEEFMLFLDRENLFDGWADGWKPVLADSLDEWDRRQAKATVRRFPDEAIEVLQSRGYQITAP